ncbi:MAG: ATP-grasp domain-containing protein [Pseudomonadales bacterium]
MKPWYIQSNFMKHQGAAKLAKALQDSGIPFTDAPLLPFEELTTWPEGEFIVYGSTRLVEYAYKQGRPGVFYDPETFNVRAWSKNVRRLLNSPGAILTAGQIRTGAPEWAWFLADQQKGKAFHFRPVCDLKPFNAQVLHTDQFEDIEKNLFGSYEVPDDTEIAISAAQMIDAEVRFFVVSGVPISGSYYRRKGKPHLQQLDGQTFEQGEAMTAADRFALQWLPHKNCVMDLALVDGKWHVLEFNCLNASGFYDHDIEGVATALSVQR